ncbi:hypothetical protein CFC21_050354 [Triticum aestivum]|uniref:DUF1618 domain-containing protein n=2 Tax=Triticum aestivum TaxID=4565 RepID=A0A9R1K4D2_WHEAT|nr:hypothetical protein CFC21_050354 [Triticum aestivum]
MSRARAFLYMVINHHRPPKPRCHRRFCGEQQKDCVYSLHRIDPSTLFHGEDEPQATAPVKTCLPPSITTFDNPARGFAPRATEFMLFGRGRDKILAVPRTEPQDHMPVLYDDASQTTRKLPSTREEKLSPLWLAIHDDLYIMEKAPPKSGDKVLSFKYSVEALVQARHSLDWAWHLLPPPPYEPSRDIFINDVPNTAAVVGDSNIWVSSKGQGTFSLGTETRAWSKVADSELPFQGQVHYAPQHGLWYGFSARDEGVLCAADLGSLASTGQQPPPPLASHELDMGIMAPEGRSELGGYSCLVHLGGGRFSVAKYYSNVAMLIGVEVERCGEVLRLIKHKSCIYPLRGNSFECLL